ncbi:putative phage abortive infection protein [Paracoccus sp. SSK6]|uniref:putative phage abortive infection protein n=1 Tax=Paracoccus sp. SSK6 TaxID=3143131 RepID=UPI00321A1E78
MKSRFGWAFSLAVVIVLCLYAGNVFLAISWTRVEDWLGLQIFSLGDRGTFGDAFAIANTLFSAIAFLGIAYGVLLQRHEITIVESNQAELQRSALTQNFETKFFQLFEFYRDIAKTISYESKSGPDAFEVYLEKMSETFIYRANVDKVGLINSGKLPQEAFLNDESWKLLDDENILILVAESYNELFVSCGDDLGRYFRTLYTLLKFIKNSPLIEEDQKFYFKLVRAQLSSHEATLLALNSLGDKTTPEFNSLLVEFGFFKNASFDNVILMASFRRIDPRAFGNGKARRRLVYRFEDYDRPWIVRYDPALFTRRSS